MKFNFENWNSSFGSFVRTERRHYLQIYFLEPTPTLLHFTFNVRFVYEVASFVVRVLCSALLKYELGAGLSIDG